MADRPLSGDFIAAFAPMHSLGCSQGVPVVLATVEVWSTCVFLRLCASRNPARDVAEAEHRRAFDAYEAAILAGTGRRAAPPEDPARLLAELPLTVTDEHARTYRPAGKFAGGSASEWRAEWRFEHGPGVGRTLTIALAGVPAVEPCVLHIGEQPADGAR